MMKWLMYLVLALLVGGSWLLYSKTGGDIKTKTELLEKLKSEGEDDKVSKLSAEVSALEGQKTFNGILLAFLSAGLVGIFFVLQILPAIAHRATHAIYDSAEMMEHDVMHDARSLLAQGEYHAAIESFKQAAAAEPLNRLPWVEIAKIYKDNLGDPDAAIQTIRYALESQEWEINDASYFLFRLAELYDEVQGDRVTATAIMQQVIEQFPNTRHSANANHKLHEWEQQAIAAEAAAAEAEGYAEEPDPYAGMSDEERRAAEEAEYLARLQAAEAAAEDEGQRPA
jgi:outer membrane protein assembly factor BamD (BamD/ComL family)